jgi:AcrR family transcriptional regulator
MTTTTPTPTSDRPLRADAVRNRARVLHAAREVFAARGLDVTLDDIARHAGLGTGTVYRRFADREAIIEALFEERVDEMVERVRACLSDPDPWDGFVALLRTTCEELAHDRGLRQVLTASSYGLNAVARGRDRIHFESSRVVGRAQEAGVLRPEFSPADIPVIFLMVGAVADFAHEPSPDIWERYFTFLVDGLRCGNTGDSSGSVDLPAALEHEQLLAAMATWRPPARPATRPPAPTGG